MIECTERMVPCPLSCNINGTGLVKAKSIHRHVKEVCEHRMTECGLGCGLMLLEKSRRSHELSSCPNRQVLCDFCHTSVTVKALSHHMKDECSLSLVECTLGCMVTGLTREERWKHEKEDCPKRDLECGKCGDLVKAMTITLTCNP